MEIHINHDLKISVYTKETMSTDILEELTKFFIENGHNYFEGAIGDEEQTLIARLTEDGPIVGAARLTIETMGSESLQMLRSVYVQKSLRNEPGNEKPSKPLHIGTTLVAEAVSLMKNRGGVWYLSGFKRLEPYYERFGFVVPPDDELPQGLVTKREKYNDEVGIPHTAMKMVC